MNISYLYHVYSVRKIMFLVIIACIPGILTKFYFFGSGVIIQTLFSVVISLILEISILKIRLKKIKINLSDNSAVLTGLLLGVSVPPVLPWWIMFIGIFFSIVITKHLYGGIGQNIFNPAMMGYAVLLICFPVQMNNWHERDFSLSFLEDFKKSANIIFLKNNINNIHNTNLNIFPDSFTEATPLNNFKYENHSKKYNFIPKNNIFKNKKINVNNSWKYINVSFFLGGMFLFFKRIICWRIPISFLTALGFLSILTHYYSQELFMSLWFHYFSGGTMMCAFFIITDPVTTACTNIGKIIFGIVSGFLVWIIRNYSEYPDAIAFSVLFANMIVPLIEFYTKTDGYGHHNI